MSATQVTAGGIALSYGYFKFTPYRHPAARWSTRHTHLEGSHRAQLISFARGTVAMPEDPNLRAEFRAIQLLTFRLISRCCSPGVQIALKWCREYLDTGHRAWHFIESTYQANYVAPAKQGGRPGQRGQSRGGGSSGWKSAKDADTKKSAKDSGRGGVNRRRECCICHSPDHLSFECPDRGDFNDDDTKGGRGRSGSHRQCRGNQPRREKQSNKSTSAKDVDSSVGGKGRDNTEASCLLVSVVEPTISLAREAGEDFQAVAAAVQANLAVVLLDSSCSHHLMGTKEAFIDLQPSGDVKHVHGFNGALQDLKEKGVKLQEDGDGMSLVSVAGDVLGRASYTGQVLCTDLRPYSTRSTSPTTEVVVLRAIVSATTWTPDRLHARLAHVGMDTIQSSAKHEVAARLDLKSASGADSPCVSCVGGKLAWHTFPDHGSDADDVLAVVHIDLCKPFRMAVKDGSLYFLLLKDRKTHYVWVRSVSKKSDALLEFQKCLVLMERQAKKSALMLRSGRGGEFLGRAFTDFVDAKGIVHDLTCPYTPQQNGMAEREMRTVRTMLLHMGVQHHWWHLALRQAFLVPEQQRGGKLKPKARWGLHLRMSEESKVWELLDMADNRVVTTSDMVFYEDMSLEVWKSEHGPVSGRTPTTPPTYTSTTTLPLLAKDGELAAEDAEVVCPPSPFPPPTTPAPSLVADLRGLPLVSASGDEGSSRPSPSAPAKSIAGG
ncbi:unnamed protein product [Closterium sp. NIES-65]|nr:unnamed protein product [Closterium sp. NIES-65]